MKDWLKIIFAVLLIGMFSGLAFRYIDDCTGFLVFVGGTAIWLRVWRLEPIDWSKS